jgi:hypothetical protein
MTRARYQTEVKLFALKERKTGLSWKKVGEHIKEKFDVAPPTPRAMEKWQKALNPENIKAELLKDVKEQIKKTENDTQITVGQKLLPIIVQASDAGEDMEAAAWQWFFHWAETLTGKEKFIKFVTKYLKDQGEL